MKKVHVSLEWKILNRIYTAHTPPHVFVRSSVIGRSVRLGYIGGAPAGQNLFRPC